MKQIKDPFHIRLRKAMIDQNIKGKDLARMIDRDPIIISRALQGKSPSAQKKIAKILNVKVD